MGMMAFSSSGADTVSSRPFTMISSTLPFLLIEYVMMIALLD
jgi:hypothetical protein